MSRVYNLRMADFRGWSFADFILDDLGDIPVSNICCVDGGFEVFGVDGCLVERVCVFRSGFSLVLQKL